jgi:hypothetical protein
MGRQQPGSVTNAIRVQAGLVLVSGVITLLTAVQRDELVAAWSARNPTADPPAFVPVAVVLFVTFALLAAVLVAFFLAGHHSARVALALLAAFSLFTMVVIYRQDPPTSFVVLAAVSSVLDVVLLALLWHRDTNAFLRGAAIAARRTP